MIVYKMLFGFYLINNEVVSVCVWFLYVSTYQLLFPVEPKPHSSTFHSVHKQINTQATDLHRCPGLWKPHQRWTSVSPLHTSLCVFCMYCRRVSCARTTPDTPAIPACQSGIFIWLGLTAMSPPASCPCSLLCSSRNQVMLLHQNNCFLGNLISVTHLMNILESTR